MVTTLAAWLAGIVLVVTCVSPVRFARVVAVVTGSRVEDVRGRPAPRASEHPLTRTCRLLGLAVGAVCLVLGVLGSVALLGRAS